MRKILIGLIAVVLLSAGCSSEMEEDKVDKVEYKQITAEEAREIMDREEVILLDVRTPEEYKEEHIEAALLIPDYELENSAESQLPDKDKKILIYCRSGNRSKSAAKLLINMGYTQVYDFGGIMSWTYDTIKGE